jgi:hypothetical protein
MDMVEIVRIEALEVEMAEMRTDMRRLGEQVERYIGPQNIMQSVGGTFLVSVTKPTPSYSFTSCIAQAASGHGV